MELIVWILHVLAAIGIIALVLLQHGKGANMGAAFGSGASGSLFGATGSANFLSRTTAVLATLFFLTSLGLTYFSAQKVESAKPLPVSTQPSAPDAPAPAAPGPGGQPVEIPR
ncbi:MAG: preprotein translocase subunit SecG [Thiobacillaceae bacterium]